MRSAVRSRRWVRRLPPRRRSGHRRRRVITRVIDCCHPAGRSWVERRDSSTVSGRREAGRQVRSHTCPSRDSCDSWQWRAWSSEASSGDLRETICVSGRSTKRRGYSDEAVRCDGECFSVTSAGWVRRPHPWVTAGRLRSQVIVSDWDSGLMCPVLFRLPTALHSQGREHLLVRFDRDGSTAC